jgi:hypothetical protein
MVLSLCAAAAALIDVAAGGGSGKLPHWEVFATRVPVLVAVDAHSSSDVWAVGTGIVHWDGQTLRVTPVPWKQASLSGVSAFSSDDVWTVGNIGWGKYPNAHETPISAHWDGHSWRRIPLPSISGRYVWLTDVVAAGPGDVWAVGGWGDEKTWPLLLHWDGSRWQRINLQRIAPVLGQLNAIDARAPNDVWAAGMEGDWREESYGYTDYVLHWNGQSWRRVPSQLEARGIFGPYALAADVGLTGDVWTLNYDLSGNGPYFERWIGPTRTASESYWLPADAALSYYKDVAVISPSDAWIVGRYEYAPGNPSDGPLIAHWNGKGWHVQHTPFDRYAHVSLNGVSAVSPEDIWAVGNHLMVRYAR